MSIIVVLDH